MISEKALGDPVAVSLAEATAAANECARQAGYNATAMRLVVRQERADDGTALWRFSYLPVPPQGLTMRGGDFMVEVNAADGSVVSALRGQ